MKQYIGITLVGVLALVGCKSTSMTTEESALVNNVCRVGDDADDKSSSWDAYKQAIMDCGGFEIFTEDMIEGKTISRTNKKGNKRVYTFNQDGSGIFVGSKGDEAMSWSLTQDGYLEITFVDGWKVTWTLLAESGQYWAVKIYDRDANDTEQYLWSSELKVEPTLMDKNQS